MRILLAGESTAGQLAPIIAVYNSLREKTKDWRSRSDRFMLISTDSDFLRAFVADTDIHYRCWQGRAQQSADQRPGFFRCCSTSSTTCPT
jgi:hypothetical protein